MPPKRTLATVHFAQGSRHTIRMEYFQDTRDAVARLALAPPGSAAQSVVSWDFGSGGGD